MHGHEQLQQPTHGSFNERVSVDLMGPFKQTQDSNDYIVVMQDHFTKWVEGRAICGKEALTVADAVVQDWILKHGAFISLHSDRGREFTAELHQGVCDLLRITRMYATAYCPQANGMVECCNRTLLSMLRAVVSECQDDWDDHLPAALSAYHSTPQSSTGVSPFCMLHGVEIVMPLDLVTGEVGQQKPEVHCPNEYVEWLHTSLRDVHTVARTNLKKSAKQQKRGYGKASRTVKFQRGDRVWRVCPSVTGGKLHGRNKGPWLVLAKTGPVTYKIQCSAGAKPELVYVDKLLSYHADFREELQSWLQDEELGGHKVPGMQTDQPVPPSNSLPEPSTSTHTVGGSPPDPGFSV